MILRSKMILKWVKFLSFGMKERINLIIFLGNVKFYIKLFYHKLNKHFKYKNKFTLKFTTKLSNHKTNTYWFHQIQYFPTNHHIQSAQINQLLSILNFIIECFIRNHRKKLLLEDVFNRKWNKKDN